MDTFNAPQSHPPRGKAVMEYAIGFFLFPALFGLSYLVNIAASLLSYRFNSNIPRILAIPFEFIAYYPVIAFVALLVLLLIRKSKMALGMLLSGPVMLIVFYLVAMWGLGQGG